MYQEPQHDEEREPVEGDYLPPDSGNANDRHDGQRRRGNTARNVGAGIAGIGLLLAKFKGLLIALLNFKFVFLFAKMFSLSWTFLLSLWLYVLFFGWQFAVILMLLLLAHELGHYAAFRAYGLPARWPQFVPFLGAYTIGVPPQNLEEDAHIALAGPLTGLGLAAASYAIGDTTHDKFWLAIASASAFLNLFNMIPTPPFDGGRVINAVWTPLWLLGFPLFIVVAAYLNIPIFFILIIGFMGLPAMIAAWRGYVDPRAATMTLGARIRVSLWYLGTLFGLIAILALGHVEVAAR